MFLVISGTQHNSPKRRDNYKMTPDLPSRDLRHSRDLGEYFAASLSLSGVIGRKLVNNSTNLLNI